MKYLSKMRLSLGQFFSATIAESGPIERAVQQNTSSAPNKTRAKDL